VDLWNWDFILRVYYLYFPYCFPYGVKNSYLPVFELIFLFDSISLIIYILRNFGMIKFSMAYFQRVMMDENTANLLVNFVLASSYPSSLLIIPSYIRSLLFVCYGFSQVLPRFVPFLWVGIVQRIVTWGTSRAAQLREQASMAEILIGFNFILQLFGANRSFLSLFLYWQNLRMKYMLFDTTRRSFSKLNMMITGFLGGKPALAGVYNGYVWITNKLSSMVDTEQMGQQAQSIGSKCTIM